MLKRTMIIASVLALTACASAPKLLLDGGKTSLLQSQKVFTQTNLHPDEEDNRLYSVNYQGSGLIPRCTEVELLEVSSSEVTFRAEGQEYDYVYLDESGSFDKNIKKYFGDSCLLAPLSKLNKVDEEGLKKGVVLKGMSKNGVILAVGYPPVRETPTTRGKAWTYWINEDESFEVLFNSLGIVKYIRK